MDIARLNRIALPGRIYCYILYSSVLFWFMRDHLTLYWEFLTTYGLGYKTSATTRLWEQRQGEHTIGLYRATQAGTKPVPGIRRWLW